MTCHILPRCYDILLFYYQEYLMNIATLCSVGAIALVAMGLTACQSTPTSPVIARADNTFETTGLGKTKATAQNNALASAKAQCGYKTPVVINDITTYNGVMDERMGRVMEQGAKVVGTILGTGSPELSRDDDYEYFIKFQCQ